LRPLPRGSLPAARRLLWLCLPPGRSKPESFKIVGIRGFGTMYALIASVGTRL